MSTFISKWKGAQITDNVKNVENQRCK